MPKTAVAGVQNVTKEQRNASGSAMSACGFAERNATNNDRTLVWHRWMEVFPAQSVAGFAFAASVCRATWEPTSAEEEMEPSSSHPTDFHKHFLKGWGTGKPPA